MTDSILRSYQAYSYTSIVPFPVDTTDSTTASYLGGTETDYFTINAISGSQTPSYVGAPYAGSVAILDSGTPANNLTNVPLDNSNLVQSGTGPKMVLWNSSPYVRWTPHNYIIQSQTLGTSWTTDHSSISSDATTAPDGSSTADKIVEANDTNNHRIKSTAATTLLNTVYTGSVYLKAAERTAAVLAVCSDATPTSGSYAHVNLSLGTIVATGNFGSSTYISSSIVDAGNGWYRVSATCLLSTAETAGQLFIGIQNPVGTDSYAGNGSSGIYAWGAQLVRGYNANPYLVTTTAARIGIPQEYDTATAKYGILVEYGRTNQALDTEGFVSGWASEGLSAATPNAGTSPDGANNAYQITENTSNTNHDKRLVVSPEMTTNYVIFSCFVKDVDRGYCYLQLFQNSGAFPGAVAYFNLSTGAVVSSNAFNGGTIGTAATVNVGNNWWRVWLSLTTGGSIQQCYARVGTCDGVTDIYAGTSKSIWIWGAQVEEVPNAATATVPSSYISNPGNSSVTRAEDAIQYTLSTTPYSATVGNFNLSIRPKIANEVSANRIYELDDGSGAETMLAALITADTPDAFGFGVVDGSSTVVDASVTKAGASSTSGNKVSTAWAANDCSIVVDGGTEVNDTSNTLPTVTTGRLGWSFAVAGRVFNGYIFAMSYFPANKTQAEMITKQGVLP